MHTLVAPCPVWKPAAHSKKTNSALASEMASVKASQYLLGRESHVHILGSNLGKWSFHLTPIGVWKIQWFPRSTQIVYKSSLQSPTCSFCTNSCGICSVGKLTEWIMLSSWFVTSTSRASCVWSSTLKAIIIYWMCMIRKKNGGMYGQTNFNLKKSRLSTCTPGNL